MNGSMEDINMTDNKCKRGSFKNFYNSDWTADETLTPEHLANATPQMRMLLKNNYFNGLYREYPEYPEMERAIESLMTSSEAWRDDRFPLES